MTKSEITVLRKLYGYRVGGTTYKPNVVSDTPEGLIIGMTIQENTRHHVAARNLEAAGLAELFKHQTDDKLRLVVPAHR